MKVAIIGPPLSGKSSVYAAVTGTTADPFAAPEVHVAMVRVPDERLTYLTELCKPKKVVEATIEFVDVPGCSLDTPAGRDEWRRVLPTVRKAELLVVVVRDFANDTVPAFRDRIDAKADFEAVWDELMFADLDAVTTRLERLEAALKKPTKTHDAEKREQVLLLRCQEALEAGKPLSSVVTSDDERRQVSSFAFLTQKPLVGIRNVSDGALDAQADWEAPHVTEMISLSASIEAEIAMLEPDDRAVFLEDLGLPAPARDRLIRTCYEACGLISFLTMGPDEVRAWTIPAGATAVDAASKIHTDLANGFIRAETVSYDDLVAHTDMKGAKAAGRVRKEGKTYVVADGDILNILSSA